MSKHQKIGEGVHFQRVRRITGYLSNLTRFNNAKQHEEQERVKHSMQQSSCNC